MYEHGVHTAHEQHVASLLSLKGVSAEVHSSRLCRMKRQVGMNHILQHMIDTPLDSPDQVTSYGNLRRDKGGNEVARLVHDHCNGPLTYRRNGCYQSSKSHFHRGQIGCLSIQEGNSIHLND